MKSYLSYRNFYEGCESSKDLRMIEKYQPPNTSHVSSKDFKGCKGCISNVMDPRLNLTECLKNMLLLEDHLQNRDKRCPDCCRKHSVLIDAYLSEAIGLDLDGRYKPLIQVLLNNYRPLEKQIIYSLKDVDNEENFLKLGQALRELRKILMNNEDCFLII